MGNTSPVTLRCRTPECSRGCDVDCVSELTEKATPNNELELLRAVRDGNLQRVIAAIANKADVNVRQPLKLATMDRHRSGQPINNCGMTALMYAASNGKASIIRALLTAKARVDEVDERGVSALHLAAASGDLEAFQEMIKAQAKPHVYTEEGESVLDFLPQDVLQDKQLHNEFKRLIPAGPDEDDVMPIPKESAASRR
eukprot:symbB.v1.2.007998.t1/scaffold471.1/size199268/4